MRVADSTGVVPVASSAPQLPQRPSETSHVAPQEGQATAPCPTASAATEPSDVGDPQTLQECADSSSLAPQCMQ